jgi:hypothetical protein
MASNEGRISAFKGERMSKVTDTARHPEGASASPLKDVQSCTTILVGKARLPLYRTLARRIKRGK